MTATVGGIVYRITNNLNGKCYVGITTNGLSRRWKEHLAPSKRTLRATRPLYAAFLKYGSDNFSIAEVATASSVEELKALERRYIAEFGTFAPGGYNLTIGGDGVTGYRPTEEQIRKHSDWMRVYAQTPEGKAAQQRATAAAARMTFVMPREAIERSRITRTGKKRTLEQRLLMSQRRRKYSDAAITRAFDLRKQGARWCDIVSVTGISRQYLNDLWYRRRQYLWTAKEGPSQ